jgi:hypothetical protein
MTRLFSFPVLALATAFLALLFIAFAGVRRGMLSVRSRALLLITAGLVLVGTVPLAIRSIRTPEVTKPNTTPKLQVVVEFTIHQPHAEVVQVPFAAGSGSVNIGCEETRPATVQYPLPPGAEQPMATADWVNTNNIESQTANVEMLPPDKPTVITAVGSIRGLRRTFLLNCPGGGHGELLLRGQYSVKHELPATPVVIKALHDVADRGQVFTATLPQEVNSQSVYFKATTSDASASSSLEGTIAPAEKGGYDLKITARDGPLPKDIRVVGQSLVMTL